MTSFPKRDAARIASQQVKTEADKLIRDFRDTADRLGTLTIDESTATVWLDGDIGPDYLGCVDAVTVRDAMRELRGRQVTFRINSGGGGVDQGLEIYNVLKEHRGGLVTRGNLIASMAGIVFQAGGQRIMEPVGSLMIHGPRCTGGGDAAEHVKRADLLRKYAERCVGIFTERSGKSEGAIRRLLETETWFSPDEAVAEGFADSVAQPTRYPRAIRARAKMFSAMCRGDAILAAYE